MEWIRGRTIGHGSFAAVSVAKPRSGNSSFPPLMAVKSCGVSHCDSLKNERMILEELKDCPEIVQCYGDSFTFENGVKLYNVALEYASGGALSEKVKNSGNSRLPESEVRRYTSSILKGLEFIHRNGFVHCDIKLQNVLLFSGDVKIADFGLAKKVTGELDSKYEIRGTPMYLAPETVTGGEQGPASDVWALGCLVTEMVTGVPVWNCSDVGALLMKIGGGDDIPAIPGKLTDAGKDFIGKCFLKDPKTRWTAEMLLNHPFINSVSFEDEAGDQTPSVSPRDPFDFPDWESEQSPESSTEFQSFHGEEAGSPEILPAARLGLLLTDRRPNWSVSNDWVKVR